METTQNRSEQEKYTSTSQNNVSTDGMISKKALIVFVVGAAIVFGVAIVYCARTEHYGVAGFLGGAVLLIAIYAASVYKSFK